MIARWTALVKKCVRAGLLVALAGALVAVMRTGPARSAASAAMTTASVSSASTQPCSAIGDPAPSNFSASTTIDNSFLPLIPGTQLILDGQANRGAGLLPHRVIFTVTDLTKVIDGVRTVVVWDRDLDEGEIQEAELSFFAQDNAGNVWNFGEYPEIYENGVFVGAPDTWIAGVQEARAGIHMLADPANGSSYYIQGFAPNIDFLDCAKVFKTGERTCVTAGCYDGVLVTDEISPLDQGGGHQRKYHASGIGIVRVGAVGDPEGETLTLTAIVKLSPSGLSKARSAALKLERRAYQVSEVYQQTEPAQ